MRIYSLQAGDADEAQPPTSGDMASRRGCVARQAFDCRSAVPNMSGDPEQEYFVDGISEDLITALSRIRWFFVIARNSCFAYKGQSPDLPEVARTLGVAYVLEGSVRKAAIAFASRRS